MFALPYHNIPCAEGSPSHVQQQQQEDDGDSLFRQRIGNMPYSVLPQYALPPLPSFTTALDPIMSTSQSYQAVDALSSVSSADSSEIYSPISPPKANSSNVHSSPPEATKSSNGSRFEIILNAAPAMLVKPEDPPLAYLNKGQFYNIQIQDKDKTDGLIFTTLLIMFHEEAHRAVARNYWSFWQSQQKDPQLARAVDIDVHRCNGVQNVTWSAFDRISFQWNGKHGASITVKFNCLSTDFSRIKGVKGIPLRLCMENQTQNSMEGVYCRIKLFRDKGAERKNKDDARHIERRLGKINTSKDNHPLWLAYNRTQPYTVLTAVPESNGSSSPTADSTPQTSPSSFSPSPSSSPCTSAPNNTLSLYQTTNPFPTTTQSSASLISCPITDTTPTLYCGVKRSRTSSSPSSSLAFAAEPPCPSQRFPFKVIDLDPSYVPNRKRRIAKLRLFVRLASDGDLHHAVYLEHLTAQDLVDKVTTKLNLVGVVKQTVRHIVRDDKIIPLLVDDEVVQHIPDEQPVQVETVTGGQDGSLTLVLKY